MIIKNKSKENDELYKIIQVMSPIIISEIHFNIIIKLAKKQFFRNVKFYYILADPNTVVRYRAITLHIFKKDTLAQNPSTFLQFTRREAWEIS